MFSQPPGPQRRLGQDPGDDGRGVLHDARDQPLVGRGRSVDGGLPLGLAGGEDVGCGAGHRARVVDRTEFGEALTVSLLAFAQPGVEFVAGLGGGFRGRWAQRIRAHHDALAVDLQHEQIPENPCGHWSLQVERLEVAGCPAREVFDLTFTQVLSAGPFDRVHGTVEGPSGALDGGELP